MCLLSCMKESIKYRWRLTCSQRVKRCSVAVLLRMVMIKEASMHWYNCFQSRFLNLLLPSQIFINLPMVILKGLIFTWWMKKLVWRTRKKRLMVLVQIITIMERAIHWAKEVPSSPEYLNNSMCAQIKFKIQTLRMHSKMKKTPRKATNQETAVLVGKDLLKGLEASQRT